MRVGFIGAGKVGFSLGKYLAENGIHVSGYFSRNAENAKEAAKFTNSGYYSDLASILVKSDTIFLTVPDRAIGEVWECMRNLPIKDKNICHCSGSISSAAFFDAEKLGAYRYSVHPLCAVSDKYESHKDLQSAYFTVEGSEQNLPQIKAMLTSCGNPVAAIDSDKKALYHAAAVMVSNQTAALAEIGAQLLMQCGFEYDDAQRALAPLIEGNAKKIAEVGAMAALTGPIERNDVVTVHGHLEALGGDIRDVYIALSRQLVSLAERKHPGRDYGEMKKELENEKYGSDL